MNLQNGKENIKLSPEGRENAYNIGMLLFLAVGEIIYFKDVIFYGKTLGCAEDGLLINMMLEHWHDVFHGELFFDTLRSFYPQTGTLGYSDILLGPGIIYSIIRDCGAGQFFALNYSLIILHILGSVFLLLSLRALGFSRRCGLLGVLLSFWSCSFSQMTWHLQFFSIAYIPMVVYGLLIAWKNRNAVFRKRLPYLILSSSAVGIVFLSSFYTAYLSCVFVFCSGGLWFIASLIRDKKGLIGCLKGICGYRKDILTWMLVLVPWMILLLRIYLPAYSQLGSYSPDMTIALAPLPMDFFRTMSYAPIELWLRSFLPFQVDAEYQVLAENIWFERSYGWSVMAIGIFLSSVIEAVKNRICKKQILDVFFYASISIMFLYLLSCRYGHFCPWANIVGKIVPGAGAIRSTGRCLGIFLIPLSFCCCQWIAKLENRITRKQIVMVAEACIFMFLAVSAVSKRYMREDTGYYEQIISNCTQPPEECEVMLLGSLEPDAYYDLEINMITWMLADQLKICTINGYTGNYPKGWDLGYLDQSSYIKAVDGWLDIKQMTDLSNLYVYVPEHNIWLAYYDFRSLIEL